MNNHVPHLNLISSISNSKLDTTNSPVRLDGINGENKITSFSDTLVNMTKELNNAVNAPDRAMEDMLSGNGDIHDVITAINKAEMSMTIATKVTSKVVQAYEKIMQIQV